MDANVESSVFNGRLIDVGRAGREIAFRAYVPESAGPWPVVIVSHGTGGSHESYSYLGRALALAGYLSLHPNHPGTDRAVLKTVRFSLNQEAILKTSLDPQNWRDRPKDIQLLLEQWPEIERQVPALHGQVDLSKLSIVGHSMGAYTALALAGATVPLPEGRSSFRDARFRAFVTISPPGDGQVFDRESWDSLMGPVLCITGSKDEGLRGEPASWRVEAFDAWPPGDKYLLFIEGATHLSFVDPLPFNDLPYVRAAAAEGIQGFLGAALQGRRAGLRALTTRAPQDKKLLWRQR
jgi:predicted dienelactone hydrolase